MELDVEEDRKNFFPDLLNYKKKLKNSKFTTKSPVSAGEHYRTNPDNPMEPIFKSKKPIDSIKVF